ncbi:MAG: transcription antitermination factor NusB [Peptococcaceae bacterium]|jgi:N utilization substance protein B|nr:transcription antitermination factor NusB [Peptococcaceae bacterium]
MGRRTARDAAFKALFWVDCTGGDPQTALAYLGDELACTGADMAFARDLVYGVLSNQAELDGIIARLSREWQVRRMPYVDRNVMRLALFEIVHRADIPAGVSANEAVELAKMYGGEESGRFVNGIVGQVAKDAPAYGREELPDDR